MASFNDAGVIVIVAKCPLPGTSKTRLIPMLGEDGSAMLAKAMLSDILQNLVKHMNLHHLILYYAPGTDEGRMHMLAIIDSLGIASDIELVPMLTGGDLKGRDLGDQLTNALNEARRRTSGGSIMFLGMDSPKLPIEELKEAFHHPAHATLCPSHDGGYGMLCVPYNSTEAIFSNVLWSHPLTALSQLKALTDCQIPVRLGRIMYDVDEPEDVRKLLHDVLVLEDTADDEQEEPRHFKSLDVSSANNNRRVVNSDFPLTKQTLLAWKDANVHECHL